MKQNAQPWKQSNANKRAISNEMVRIGTRELPSGKQLRGIYALQDFKPGDVVCSYHGQFVRVPDLAKIRDDNPAKFEMITEYGVWGRMAGTILYPTDIDALGAHLINHSCAPVADWKGYHGSVMIVRATKPIESGQEITIHYGWAGLKAAMEKNIHPCNCGARMCCKTIELKVDWLKQERPDGKVGWGPRLGVDEMALRLVADMTNDTNAHEDLLIRYPTEAKRAYLGAVQVSQFDGQGYAEKLIEAADIAIKFIRKVQSEGVEIAPVRVHQIEARYLGTASVTSEAKGPGPIELVLRGA